MNLTGFRLKSRSNITSPNRIYLGLQKYEYVSFPRRISQFPSSHSLWYYQNSQNGRLIYPHCHNLSNATLDEIQFCEQYTKWIKTNEEYVLGLTGEQLALWKLHYKSGLQQHIDDKVFFAQIADQKIKVTSWEDMYQLEQSKCDQQKQIYRLMKSSRIQQKPKKCIGRQTNTRNLNLSTIGF